MRLTPSEFSLLEGALLDGTVDYDDLGRIVRRTGNRIQDIAGPGALPSVVTKTIEFAEAHDSVHELVAAARASNSSNVELFKVAAAFGLEPGGVPAADLAKDEDDALRKVSTNLERMVGPDRPIADFGSFAAKIQEFVMRICRIELDEPVGTGFLIGPETILTNYHVVESVIESSFRPADVRVRFDYRRLRDGLTTNPGVAYQLAEQWLVVAERYSDVDNQPYDPTRRPSENELDYAVLRTSERIGLEPPSDLIRTPRGWIAPTRIRYAFPKDSYLMVVQHPCDDPIAYDDVENAVICLSEKSESGQTVCTNANGTRVHYRNNTMPGSSGSPVFNDDLELVAVHHSGEPGPDYFLECKDQLTPATYNEGIPIDKIEASLASKNLSWVFGSVAP
jgi:hypothetical protein